MVWQYCWWIVSLVIMYTKSRGGLYYGIFTDDDDDVVNYGIIV